jgi:hypothetical protein
MSDSETKGSARRCVFCGGTSSLTREHVLPNWLSQIGLDLTPSVHHSGPLNHVPRQWSSKPFTTTVKMVCVTCNGGWLSALENAARPVLAPLIRGGSRRLPDDDQALVAAWTCKTALVSQLLSSEEARRGGQGLPSSEYVALYEQRELMEPLPFSQYWIGSYAGDRGASIWVTPFVVEVTDAGSPPDIPTGYAMTLVLGSLLVQGVRFTEPALQIELATDLASAVGRFPSLRFGVDGQASRLAGTVAVQG